MAREMMSGVAPTFSEVIEIVQNIQDTFNQKF